MEYARCASRRAHHLRHCGWDSIDRNPHATSWRVSSITDRVETRLTANSGHCLCTLNMSQYRFDVHALSIILVFDWPGSTCGQLNFKFDCTDLVTCNSSFLYCDQWQFWSDIIYNYLTLIPCWYNHMMFLSLSIPEQIWSEQIQNWM